MDIRFTSAREVALARPFSHSVKVVLVREFTVWAFQATIPMGSAPQSSPKIVGSGAAVGSIAVNVDGRKSRMRHRW